MAFNNSSNTDLSRYSIGEIVDLSGVSDFYDAGSSKWLKSAAWTSASNLTAETKLNLSNASTAYNLNIKLRSDLSRSYDTQGLHANYTPARISAISTTVIPCTYKGTTKVGVAVINNSGIQYVATGQTSIIANTDRRSNAVVLTNGTEFFSYCFTSDTQLSLYKSTDGLTWTDTPISGTATFTGNNTSYAWGSLAGSGSPYTYTGHSAQGIMYGGDNSTFRQFGVWWCGSKFLLLGYNSTTMNVVTSTSSNGVSWDGNNTAAILGGTGIAANAGYGIQFFKNGNNCYLKYGSTTRYTSDGGVTWSTPSGSLPSGGTLWYKFNKTDPAKVFVTDFSNNSYWVTIDSGASWTTGTLPINASPTYGVAYNGNTVIIADGNGQYRSINNGSTWTPIALPIGTLGSTYNFVFSDANRFYMGIGLQKQILISSDAITWTIVTIPTVFAVSMYNSEGPGIISFDSNYVCLMGYNNQSGYGIAIYTSDGGITWKSADIDNNQPQWAIGDAYITPDGGGVGFFQGISFTSGSSGNILKSDLIAGGSYYRTSTTAITPLRANSTSYVRVG